MDLEEMPKKAVNMYYKILPDSRLDRLR